MKKTNKPERIEPTPPEQLSQREQQLRDEKHAAYRATNGWMRKGNPSWSTTEGRGLAKKDTPTRSLRQIKTQSAVQMANLARSAMAKFGYDGTGLGGAEGYMTMLAQRFPLQFMTDVIAKMIPANVDANVSGQVDLNMRYESTEDARRDIGQLAVPLDLLLERDDPPLLEAPEKGNGQG
jgi:hypothetical protein